MGQDFREVVADASLRMGEKFVADAVLEVPRTPVEDSELEVEPSRERVPAPPEMPPEYWEEMAGEEEEPRRVPRPPDPPPRAHEERRWPDRAPWRTGHVETRTGSSMEEVIQAKKAA